MRIPFILFLFFVSGLRGYAQQEFNYLACQKVMTEKVEAIQLKIWNGVMEGKLTPYNDSMTRVISVVEIRELCKGVDTIKNKRGIWGESWSSSYEWPDDSTFIDEKWHISFNNLPMYHIQNDTIDLRLLNIKKIDYIRCNFDSSRDLRGLCFLYEKTINQHTFHIGYKLNGIGLLYDYITPEGNNLGVETLLSISIKELENITLPQEMSFVKNIAMQMSNLEQYVSSDIPYIRTLSGELQKIEQFRFGYTKRAQFLTQYEIGILTYYNQRTFNSIGDFIISKGSTLQQDMFLFKDKHYKNPYKNIAVLLSFEGHTDSIIEEQSPVIMIRTRPPIPFVFFYQDNLTIKQNSKDFQLCFNVEVQRVGAGNKHYFENNFIYLSYSSIKHLLQPHDRIILEALMEEIVNK